MTGKTRRSFSRRGRLPWMGLCIAGTLAALASCSPRSEYWSNAETNRELEVDRVEHHHVVTFSGSGAVAGEGALTQLNIFLDRHARGRHGVRAWIAGGDTLLDVRRQAAIMSHLRKRGLNGRLDGGAGAPRPQPGTVRVTLVRHTVTLPTCGDWSKDAAKDYSNQPSANFGCTTAANLGMMVADPGVLVRAPDIGPGDGEALAKGVDMYRQDRVKISKKLKEFSLDSETNKTKTNQKEDE